MRTETSTDRPLVAISISESPDMGILGFGKGHLRDAMADIAAHLLASGYNLAYGGDLREDGFTRLLFELVSRYTPEPGPEQRGESENKQTQSHHRVVNYLPWPVHIRMQEIEIDSIIEVTKNVGSCVLLDFNGEPMTIEERRKLNQSEPDDDEWATGLTNMRMTMLNNTQARILLGGRVARYKGTMPGIAEEALISMKADQPAFILGGFGGAARDVAESIKIAPTWEGSRDNWQGKAEFADFGPESLKNGLAYEENELLATAPHINTSIPIILRGLRNTIHPTKHMARSPSQNRAEQ